MAIVKKIKKIVPKKEIKKELKLIPLSLLCSFILVFFKNKCLNVNGCIVSAQEPIIIKLDELGYSIWLVPNIPDKIVTISTDQQKSPSYCHYLEKFIKDFFEIEIIKIRSNEYFIDKSPKDEFNNTIRFVKEGLESLGFVVK